MKISEIKPQADPTQYIDQTQKLKQLEKNQVSQSSEATNQQADRVDLSEQSKEMQKIYNVLQMTPEIRSERVDDVKKLIEENRYQVESKAVADKMIRESLFDRFLEGERNFP
jgi:negative regulator of flagellin synthesis FlgM